VLPAVDAEELAMEGISGHGCRLPFTGYLQRGLGSVEDSLARESGERGFGEATGMSEARHGSEVYGRQPHTRTRAARRSGALRREALGPPVTFSRSQGRGRVRGASLEKMLGTREARVLVVEAVGSRSWSERIELELPALLQGRSGKGELVRRKPLIR
jgi:hypothetical protein